MTAQRPPVGAAGARLPARLFIGLVLFLAALVPVLGGAYLTTFLFTLLSAYIVAQSWDWLHGEAGYVNLGHYIYFGIGAYAFALANVNGVPVIVSFLVAALFTGLAAALLSFPLFRLRGDYFAFATLALLPLFELLATNLTAITRGADGVLLPPATAMIHGIDVKMYAYYVALAASVAVFCLSIWISRRPFGYALKAIRNDEQVAEVVGIRIFPMKLKAMALGAMAATIAGGAYVWSFRYIDPRTVFGLDVALIPVAMAVPDREDDDAAVHHHRARHPADRPLHAGRAVACALAAARPAARPVGAGASREDRGG
jgi:branched-chain amino acid transport system permease protein